MKRLMCLAVAVCVAALALGCAPASPAISKSNLGNLELSVYRVVRSDDATSDGSKLETVMDYEAEIYIDDVFIGNNSQRMPVLYLKRGPRQIRVVSPGCKPYEKTLLILGHPNHQIVNVKLEPN